MTHEKKKRERMRSYYYSARTEEESPSLYAINNRSRGEFALSESLFLGKNGDVKLGKNAR
jgi:hypothetical protein